MPIYEYEAVDQDRCCSFCARPFSIHRSLRDPPLEKCPKCGTPVRKLVSCPNIGVSSSGFDRRAKEAGFHKLKRLGKGEYEKVY